MTPTNLIILYNGFVVFASQMIYHAHRNANVWVSWVYITRQLERAKRTTVISVKILVMTHT